jgi:hypothetical protein
MGVKLRDVLAHGNVIECPTGISISTLRNKVATSAGGYSSMMTGMVAMMSGEGKQRQ